MNACAGIDRGPRVEEGIGATQQRGLCVEEMMRFTDVKPEPLQHQSCDRKAGPHRRKQITAEVVFCRGGNHRKGIWFNHVHTRVDEATESVLRRGFFGEATNKSSTKIAVDLSAVRSTKSDDAKGTGVLHLNKANRQRCTCISVMGEKASKSRVLMLSPEPTRRSIEAHRPASTLPAVPIGGFTVYASADTVCGPCVDVPRGPHLGIPS